MELAKKIPIAVSSETLPFLLTQPMAMAAARLKGMATPIGLTPSK